MHLHDDLPNRFEALLDALQQTRAEPEALASRVDNVIATGRALLDAHEILSATLEAREAQVDLQQSMLRELGLPIIQVHSDVLCAPIIGELDPDRAARLLESLLRSAADRGVNLVVIDMTGATFGDASTARYLIDVVHALKLVGVRGVLSGMTSAAATQVVELPDGLGAISCYATVARAVEAHAAHRGGNVR